MLAYLLVLLLLTPAFAQPIAVEGSTAISVTSPLLKVVGQTEVNGNLHLKLQVTLPNTCYRKVGSAEVEHKGDAVYVEIPIYTTGGPICGQKISTAYLDVNVGKTEDKRVIVRAKIEKEEKEEEKFRIENRAGVEYTTEVRNDALLLHIKGCFEYNVVPMKCPNCFEVYLKPIEGCESTDIKLELSGSQRPLVKLLAEMPACEDMIRRIAAEDNELTKMLRIRCREMPFFGLGPEKNIHEKLCEVLEEANSPLYKRYCAEGTASAEGVQVEAEEGIRVLDIKREENRVILHLLVDTPTPCYRVKPKVEQEGNRVEVTLYLLAATGICPAVVKPQRVTVSFRAEGNVYVHIKKEEETVVEKKRDMVRIMPVLPKFRVKIERGAVVVPELNEVIKVPKVEVEVSVKGKKVKIRKEGNRLEIETPGVRAVVRTRAEIQVEGNTILVNGRPINVLPDEVLKKIREKLRAEVEEIEVETEENKPVYKVVAKKKGRLFFILPVEVPVEAYIDAETGAELQVKAPWWSIFVFG